MEITMTIKVGETELTFTVEEYKELKEKLNEFFEPVNVWESYPSTKPTYPNLDFLGNPVPTLTKTSAGNDIRIKDNS